MVKIYQDVWYIVRSDVIRLSRHFILSFLTFVIIWIENVLINILFPNTTIIVKILFYISEITIIAYLIRENVRELLS